jgi:hypothetical protein
MQPHHNFKCKRVFILLHHASAHETSRFVVFFRILLCILTLTYCWRDSYMIIICLGSWILDTREFLSSYIYCECLLCARCCGKYNYDRHKGHLRRPY